MTRTLVMLFDGTSNGFDEKRTNILRLYGCLRKTPAQVVWYDPGIGTIATGASRFEWRQRLSEWIDQAFGCGIDTKVKEAYRFLVETCERSEGERICLMGYSRGAYSARMLAGFLHTVGLIEPRNLNLLDHLWRAYRRIGENGRQAAFEEVRLYERILRPHRPTIHLLGLFDTVSSVIEWRGFFRPVLSHHAHTSRNPSVAHVRYALSLDETRAMFEPVHWPLEQDHLRHFLTPASAVPQDAVEMWFTGAHVDIGGGLPESESGLAKIPLDWMITETARLGLDYKPEVVADLVHGIGSSKLRAAPDPMAKVTRFSAFWRLLEIFWPWRKGGLRKIRPGTLLHETVHQRARQTGKPPANPGA